MSLPARRYGKNRGEADKYAQLQAAKGIEVNRFYKLLEKGLKECKRCQEQKPLDCFSSSKVKHGKRSTCKTCESQLNKIYISNNKERINQQRRNRRKDPIRGIIFTQRDRQRSLFRNKKAIKKQAHTFLIRDWLGCTVNECKFFLEGKFSAGMNWGNRGVGKNYWQIDHIIPVSLTEIDGHGNIIDNDFNRKIWHYTNLQPLWHLDNAKKSNRYAESSTSVSIPIERACA